MTLAGKELKTGLTRLLDFLISETTTATTTTCVLGTNWKCLSETLLMRNTTNVLLQIQNWIHSGYLMDGLIFLVV